MMKQHERRRRKFIQFRLFQQTFQKQKKILITDKILVDINPTLKVWILHNLIFNEKNDQPRQCLR